MTPAPPCARVRRTIKATGRPDPYPADQLLINGRPAHLPAGRRRHHAERTLLHPGQSRIQSPGTRHGTRPVLHRLNALRGAYGYRETEQRYPGAGIKGRKSRSKSSWPRSANRPPNTQSFFQYDLENMVELDFIFARAGLAMEMNATEPLFNTDGIISLRKARHPLIERRQVVPIDLTLGEAFDLLIVTGPNTGGKTVSLKTVGLLSLMGQSGLHIPALDRSELAII